MKTKFALLLLIIGVVGLFLGGCGCFQQQIKGETNPPPAPEAQVAAPEPKQEIAVEPPAPPPPAAVPVSVVVLIDVNFDFDRYNIRSGDAEILKQNMEWFNTNSGRNVTIEGNCDERGTVEYNLALGQRRADSTKEFLASLGVSKTLLKTVSYGKEKPLCTEQTEECWARNRRAHFVPVQ